MRAIRGAAGWQPTERWEISRTLRVESSRRAFESPTRMAAKIPSRCSRIVRANSTNGRMPRRPRRVAAVLHSFRFGLAIAQPRSGSGITPSPDVPRATELSRSVEDWGTLAG
jgi:hypothetical protein